MCAVCELSWMTNLTGKDAVLKLFSQVLFSLSSLWLWNLTLNRSTWLLFNFILFLHWIAAAQRPSFINQFVVGGVIQWKAAGCRIHLRPVMVRYRLAKVLRGVHCSSNTQKICQSFWKLTPARANACHSENFSGKLCCCCCCYIISSTYGRIKVIISLNL